MNPSRSKAVQTRMGNLKKQFETDWGRIPSPTELDLLYKDEMRRVSNMSSRNKKGTGGFAYLAKNNPEYLKQITTKGGKNGKRQKVSESKS